MSVEYPVWCLILALFIPFIDAFISIFPLAVVVAVTVSIYGFFKGFLISWIGNVSGTILFFLFLKKHRHKKIIKKLFKTDRESNLRFWIKKRGFTPVFILQCIPFSPATLVIMFSAFLGVRNKSFIFATILAKTVMIFLVSFVGQDLSTIHKNPLKLLLSICVLLLIWYIGKLIEKNSAYN